jgi:putative glutamine amidotransferase
MPLLAVCRGFQEMNVSFGGTLHQMVHLQPGYLMHKENQDEPLDVQYSPSHKVTFSQGGMLETITGKESAMVNSLHSQGVNRLGEELVVEAVADDGLVEGFTVRNSPGFTLALQWHPEWKVLENPVSSAIFKAYGEACRSYRQGASAPH